MKISMDGFRTNLIRDYNKCIVDIVSSLDDNVDCYSDREQILRDIEESFDSIRSDINLLLCLYDPENEDKYFINMADKGESLYL